MLGRWLIRRGTDVYCTIDQHRSTRTPILKYVRSFSSLVLLGSFLLHTLEYVLVQVPIQLPEDHNIIIKTRLTYHRYFVK